VQCTCVHTLLTFLPEKASNLIKHSVRVLEEGRTVSVLDAVASWGTLSLPALLPLFCHFRKGPMVRSSTPEPLALVASLKINGNAQKKDESNEDKREEEEELNFNEDIVCPNNHLCISEIK